MRKGNALTIAKASVPHAMRTRRGQSADNCVQMLCTCTAARQPADSGNAMGREVTPSHTMSRQRHASSVTPNSERLPNKSGMGLGGAA